MSEDIDNENFSRDRLNMYFGVSPKLFELAEELRGRMIEEEKKLPRLLLIKKSGPCSGRSVKRIM